MHNKKTITNLIEITNYSLQVFANVTGKLFHTNNLGINHNVNLTNSFCLYSIYISAVTKEAITSVLKNVKNKYTAGLYSIPVIILKNELLI